MKRKFNIITFVIALLIFVFFVKNVEAQNGVLTLDDCRSMAIETNYNLKSANEKVLISEDVLAAYKTNNLPNFSVNANYLYSTSNFLFSIAGGYLPIVTNGEVSSESFAYMPDQEFDLKIGSVYNMSAMVTQPIYLGGKISNAVKLAGLGVDVSLLETKKTEAEVIELADGAFSKVLELQELLVSAQKYQIVVEEFHRQIENACKRGMAKRNDVMKVEVRLNEAKLMTQKATNGLRLAKMNLCYVIGLPLTTRDVELSDFVAVEQMVDDQNLDITSRPEYAMLQKQIEAKELEVKITRSDFLPSVSAIATYGYTGGASLNGSTLLGSDSFSGGVMVSVPIFHWGEGRRKTSAKRREVNVAQNQMDDLSQQMKLELLQAANNYNESVLEVHLTAESVEQASENMRLSKNQYNVGMETIADYLESQALWQKAMSDLCSAKSFQRKAYTRYLKCRGELVVR